MRFSSAGDTGIISSYSRFALFERLRRRWLLPWRVRMSFPEPVTLIRLAVAWCVLSFGMNNQSSTNYEKSAHSLTPHTVA